MEDIIDLVAPYIEIEAIFYFSRTSKYWYRWCRDNYQYNCNFVVSYTTVCSKMSSFIIPIIIPRPSIVNNEKKCLLKFYLGFQLKDFEHFALFITPKNGGMVIYQLFKNTGISYTSICEKGSKFKLFSNFEDEYLILEIQKKSDKN